MRYDVFISHSSKDGAIAQAICSAIESRGMRGWIAPRNIEPGEDWPTAIVSAIDNSCILVLVLSRHSNASAQVKRELERAGSLDIPIIPVRAEAVAPAPALAFFINTAQWLDIPAKPGRDSLEPLVTRAQRLAAERRAQPKPTTPSTSMLRLKPFPEAAAGTAPRRPPTPEAKPIALMGEASPVGRLMDILPAIGQRNAILAIAAALVAATAILVAVLSQETEEAVSAQRAPATARPQAVAAQQQGDCSNPNFPCYSADNGAPSFLTSEDISGFASVLSIGALEIQKKRIELAYVEDDPTKPTFELAAFVAGGAVLCKPAGAARKYLCSGGPTNSDLSNYVISRGLARPSAESPESVKRAYQSVRR